MMKDYKAMKKSELAWMLSPDVSQNTALNRLSRWINGDREMMERLKSLGYRSNQRILSPAMVKVVLEYLGTLDDDE